MFEIKAMEKLKEDSLEVNKCLKEINCLLDDQMTNVDGMCDISQRIKKAFSLYKTLVADMEDQFKEEAQYKD